MSVLSEIYVASPDRATDYDIDPTPFRSEAALYKNFTTLELSMLWAAVQGREWDDGLLDPFSIIMEKDDGARLITRVPDAFLLEVLAVDGSKRDHVLTQWAAHEEVGWMEEVVGDFWNDLRRLADVAIKSERGMFLWNCV